MPEHKCGDCGEPVTLEAGFQHYGDIYCEVCWEGILETELEIEAEEDDQ